MAKDYSFDVVCRTNLQEAANAVNQAAREIGTRYDFKGSKSSVSLEGANGWRPFTLWTDLVNKQPPSATLMKGGTQ